MSGTEAAGPRQQSQGQKRRERGGFKTRADTATPSFEPGRARAAPRRAAPRRAARGAQASTSTTRGSRQRCRASPRRATARRASRARGRSDDATAPRPQRRVALARASCRQASSVLLPRILRAPALAQAVRAARGGSTHARAGREGGRMLLAAAVAARSGGLDVSNDACTGGVTRARPKFKTGEDE